MATQSDATSVTMMATDPDLRALADFQHSDTYIKVVRGTWSPPRTSRSWPPFPAS